ncbi:hypothetical protein [Bifidobacterium callimiconis]|uniref:hypothetical protein n=1 Tax=Bifidobacterium callimiconis TaxID=2306973 RepID=UPI0013DED4D3|nr:hypothetical protein [Bifidobacterium callimiconis]
MQTLEQQGLSPALSDTEAIRLAHEEAMKEPMDLDQFAKTLTTENSVRHAN